MARNKRNNDGVETTNVKVEPTAEEKKTEPKIEIAVDTPKEKPAEQQNNLADLIKELKDNQTKEIERLKEQHAKELEERNAVIKQLISGEEATKTNEGTKSVADLINKKRIYKKW